MKLTATDKAVLASYAAMLDGLSDYLGASYEVVLHSLEDLNRSVIKIINGHYSNREAGAPITDLALSMLKKIEHNDGQHQYMTYFNRNKRGMLTKSSTIPIIGEKGRIIGLLCSNFYMDTSFSSVIESFVPKDHGENPEEETFAVNTNDLILSNLESTKQRIYNDASIQSSNKNKEILYALYSKGIFNLKDSVVTVAQLLGISKNTVYMHIRNFEKSNGNNET